MSGKRYYWLKLKDDFFTSKRIKKLRKLAGGDTYTIIYLKMQLLAIKKDGLIEYTGLEKTFADELALDLDEDADNVRVTLNYLMTCGLCECSDNVNYIFPYAVENVGSEGTSAQRMRDLRARTNAEKPDEIASSVTMCALSDGEKEKRERDRERDRDREKKNARAENVMLSDSEYQTLIDKYGEKDTARLIEILDNYKGQSGKKYKSDYRAILNWVVGRLKEEKERTNKPTQGKAPLQTYQGGSEELAMLRRLEDDFSI